MNFKKLTGFWKKRIIFDTKAIKKSYKLLIIIRFAKIYYQKENKYLKKI